MERRRILQLREASRTAVAALFHRFQRQGYVADRGITSEFDAEGFTVQRGDVRVAVQWRDGSGMDVDLVGSFDKVARDEVLNMIEAAPLPIDPVI
jgi:hypothetical protein